MFHYCMLITSIAFSAMRVKQNLVENQMRKVTIRKKVVAIPNSPQGIKREIYIYVINGGSYGRRYPISGTV